MDDVPLRNGSPGQAASHVLVVDDDKAIRQMLIDLLEDDGLTVSGAANGAAALARLEVFIPDLVLMDARMPILDGFATCAQIRTQPGGAELPILMITALSDAASVEQAFAAGADDVLFKPLHLALLRARVRQLLQARRDALRRQASEARFRGAFEHAAIGMALIALDGQMMQVNRALCAMLGYTESELIGQSAAFNAHPDDRLVGQIEAGQAREGALDHYQLDKRYLRKDGSTIHCLINLALVRDQQGKPLHLVSQIQDITTRKEAEERVRRSEAHLREAQRLAQLGSWTSVIADDTLMWSDETYLIFGVSQWTFAGTREAFMELVHPDDRAAVEAVRLRSIAGDEPLDIEHRIIRPDGEVRVVAERAARVLDQQGQPIALVGTVHDITDRARAATALRLRDRAIAAATNGILITDATAPDHPIVVVNPAFVQMTGYTEAEALGRNCRFLQGPATDPATITLMRSTVARGEQIAVEILNYRKDGSPFWNALAMAPIHDAWGRLTHFVGIQQDITARRDAEAALLASEEYLRALVEHSAEIITVIDAAGIVRYSSPAQQRLLGYVGDESSTHIFAHIHPDDQPLVTHHFQQFTANSAGIVTTELRVRHADGSWRVFEATGTNLLDNPAVRGIVVNSHDITERKRVAEQLAYDAFHDVLTGLPNRALLVNRLDLAIDRAIRARDRCCAVLFLNIDHFKKVNDSLGHKAGNELLVGVARRLERCVRPGDTVARLGGDEFAILLEDLTTADTTTEVVARITAALQESIALDGHEVVTSASIGIAVSAPGGARADDLLRDADIAMYDAKRGGPGRYALADPSMHAAIVARLRMEADLGQALAREEFVLHYQPIMAMDGRALQSVEALIRWRHPTRGMVAPLNFIPLAEETGLIVPIGAWALRQACAQLRDWRATGLPQLSVAVNLSARQFKQPEIAATIHNILAETELEPHFLCLELTESILMDDAEATVMALHELRGAGIGSLAIDDFGTGYSSLSYLQRFPVTEIKIDRSFVRDITTNPRSAAIATSTIALAHSLDLKVVAEGVETEEQRVFLEHAGCDKFQGYLVSPPMPADQLSAFAQAKSRLG